jgi:lipopolysaccharide export system protein LptA
MTFRPSTTLLAALLLMAATAGAQQPDVTVWRPGRGQGAPVHISADDLAVNHAQRAATFSGHVRVSQGSTHLQCSQARVWYRAKGPDRPSAIDHLECQP